jgi:hypothetical protein
MVITGGNAIRGQNGLEKKSSRPFSRSTGDQNRKKSFLGMARDPEKMFHPPEIKKRIFWELAQLLEIGERI